jgi:hypothetical protein
MKEALEGLYEYFPHFRGQPEDKLMSMLFRYISQPAIDEEKYNELHTEGIVATDIDIDIDQFTKDIKKYSEHFSQWGNTYKSYPRFGLPLVNLTGKLDEKNDPSRMPLDEHFMIHQDKDNVVFDHEILEKTEVCNMPSLEKLMEVFGDYMCRSAILKWDTMGHFKPHVDVVKPAPNLRLWGTTSTNMQLKMDGKVINSIKPGKIYIFDSSLKHEAFATGDNVYQFFIALTIDAYDTMMDRRL